MSNYAKKKTDLKKTTGFDISEFAKNVDYANLKSGVDDLDIDKLKSVLVDLSKIRIVVKKWCC